MDKTDEIIVDVALQYNGRKDWFAGRNIEKEMEAIARGEEKVVETNKKLADSQKEVAKSGFQLGKALRTLGIYIGIKQIAKYADEWQNVSNILSQITKTDEERLALQEKLYQVGQRTRTGLSSSVDIYKNLGASGLSERQQLVATETLQKAFKITGGDRRTVEAIRRMLKTGKLSTLLGIDQQFAEIVASGLSMSLEQLQKKMKKGGLTAIQVLTAISNKQGEIDEKFAKTKTKLDEALKSVRESFTRQLGLLEENYGAFSKIAKIIEFIGKHIEHVMYAIGAISLVKIGKLLKASELFGAFFIGMKDGIGIIHGVKNAFYEMIGMVKKSGLSMLKPLTKVLYLIELIQLGYKIITGKWNMFYQLIDWIERGTWKVMDFLTGQNKYQNFKGSFTANPVKPARMVTNSGVQTQNIVQNQDFNITVYEARDGLKTVETATSAAVRQSNTTLGIARGV